ncbi:hypothetical protein [Streptomyces sp. TS71-3]|uniref:hypothetical protein n=1 Tax=Streptomyces sp. TS71-3 TaxID=2733862 RepID=UPI001B0CF19E|nr:hypothetical protein [Streptomyces sp. TS71-3]GHJ39938.1 hypothetical protein Sm713_55470 [Streptomyces sp. TS71-3]
MSSGSAFSFNLAAVPPRPPGASAATGTSHQHRLGEGLRAIRVYVSSAFEVAVLGEYWEEAGVRIRRR